MNKNILEKSTKEEVSRLFGLWIENLPLALSKVSDPNVLKELLILAVQKNRIDIKKITIKRLDEIGVSYDKSFIF